jgi:hypothetical protein
MSELVHLGFFTLRGLPISLTQVEWRAPGGPNTGDIPSLGGFPGAAESFAGTSTSPIRSLAAALAAIPLHFCNAFIGWQIRPREYNVAPVGN